MELLKTTTTTPDKSRVHLYKRLYAALFSAKKNNEFLHSMITVWFNKSSLRDLTDAELKKTIENINAIKDKSTPSFQFTHKQYKLIMHLKSSLFMNANMFAGFMLKTCGKDNLNSLNVSDATDLITGLLKFQKSLKHKNEKV